jgi:hypothetical protein
MIAKAKKSSASVYENCKHITLLYKKEKCPKNIEHNYVQVLQAF